MIPQTYPSILDSSNRTKMLVYQVPSITGLTRWVDYIPVKSPASESDLTLANTYANEGFILTSKVNDITGLVPFKDYVPIYLDSTATKAWSADNDGYIPMAELAGLLLDFTTGRLDSRINFTRTSNATVTNSLGTIAYAPHNLLTYSEQFDNAAWAKTNTTVTANSIIAPDGTTTADSLVDNTTNGGHIASQVATYPAGALTVSIYVKANSLSKIMLYSYLEGKGVGFDASNGTTFTVSGVSLLASYSITPAANGFYRCSITTTATVGASATLVFGVYTVSGTAFSYAGTGQSVYIWGAQLEVGTSPTAYNSTTVRNLLGFSELFDNAAWTKSNSFVQSNLLTYSEQFDSIKWIDGSAGVTTKTANYSIAPNGTQTADRIQGNNANTWLIQDTLSQGWALKTVTLSFYIKANTGTPSGISLKLQFNGGVTYSKNITVTSDWQRFEFTQTFSASDTQTLFVGLNHGNGNDLSIWGAQLVQGSVAGNYRRTDSTSLPCYYANHNGVVCAEKLVENTATSTHYIDSAGITTTASPYTLSIYAKAGENKFLGISETTVTNAFAYFNLETGLVGTVGAAALARITQENNGWYRCSITFTSTAASNTSRFFTIKQDNTASFTGDGTSGIYIFGAQLSDSASLDTYVLNAAAAPTAAAYYGPRFDYDPVTLQPKGLLIEEQRANLVLNSTIDGANLATQNVTVTAQAYTLSFYGTGQIVLSGTASATVTGTGAYPTRKTLTFTPTAGTLTLTVTGTVQYAQLEAGSFATSYIPTGASQATRTADGATVNGSNFYSWYNQNEGTFFVEGSALWTAPNTNRYIASLNGVTGFVWYSDSAGTNVQNYDGANVLLNPITNWNINKKYTSSYKASTKKLAVAGVIVQGNYNNGYGLANGITLRGFDSGYIKRFSFYSTDLSDATQKGLTA